MTNNFQELMRHFDMAFSICYAVPIILFINIIRAYKNMSLRHMWIEAVLDLALGFGLLRFAVFMGVVEDITSAYSHWTYQLIAIIMLSFVLMVIHMILLLRRGKRTA